MARKHFKAIADTFRNTYPSCLEANHEHVLRQQWRADVQAMANTLAQLNDRFDKEKFINACQAVTGQTTGY